MTKSSLTCCQSHEAEVLKHLAEKREYAKEVVQKAMEENSNFCKMAQEKLNQKMEANKENRTARLAALNEKFKEKVSCSQHTNPHLHSGKIQSNHDLFLNTNRTRRSKKCGKNKNVNKGEN